MRFFFHVNLSYGEILGVFVSLLGLMITLLDDLMVVQNNSSQWIGDLICFICSFFNAGAVFASRHARKVIPVYTFTSITTIILLFVTAPVAVVWESTLLLLCSVLHPFSPILFSDLSLSASPDGVFGWYLPEFVFIVCLFAFAVGVVGDAGTNLVLPYISPLLYSVSLLVQLPLTAFFAWALGIMRSNHILFFHQAFFRLYLGLDPFSSAIHSRWWGANIVWRGFDFLV